MFATLGDPMSDFDLYRPTEEHEALREAIRSVAEDKIAPHAADVDEQSRFPQEAYEALRASDCPAPHVAEEYGGVGADALATCIVIEEIARVCASSSLIPAVNKLGSMPLILSGSDEVKQRYLPELASGEAMFSYGLSEREAGSDTASMRTRAVRDGDDWILNGQKSWITNANLQVHRDGGHRPGGARTQLRFRRPHRDPGSLLETGRSSASKVRPRGTDFDNVRIPGDRLVGKSGKDCDRAGLTTRVRPSVRRPSASPRARWTMRWRTSRSGASSVRRSRSSKASSSCSPTWP